MLDVFENDNGNYVSVEDAEKMQEEIQSLKEMLWDMTATTDKEIKSLREQNEGLKRRLRLIWMTADDDGNGFFPVHQEPDERFED